MDTLDKYLTREFLIYFSLILLSLALVFLGVDFLSNFWKMNLPFHRILTSYAYRIPSVLQQFVPVACLMGTLLVITQMSRQNEVLALYSGGVSTLRIVSTFVAAVAIVSTVSFLLFDSIVPSFNRKHMLINRGLDETQEFPFTFGHNGFWYRSGNLVYRIGRFIPEQNKIEDLQIYLFTPSFYLLERIEAKEAYFINNEWELRKGTVIAYPEDTKFPQAKKFENKQGLLPEKPADFKSLKLEEDTLRLKDLRRYIQRNANFGLDTTAQKVTYHERIAMVFAPLIFVLLGIPFGLTPLKNHNPAKSVAFCFLIVFLYLLLFKLSLSIGKSGNFPPFLAAWLPNLSFLSYASWKYWKGH